MRKLHSLRKEEIYFLYMTTHALSTAAAEASSCRTATRLGTAARRRAHICPAATAAAERATAAAKRRRLTLWLRRRECRTRTAVDCIAAAVEYAAATAAGRAAVAAERTVWPIG